MKTIALCGIKQSGRTFVASKFIELGFVEMDLADYKKDEIVSFSSFFIAWRKLISKAILSDTDIRGIVIDGISTELEIKTLQSSGIICVWVHTTGSEFIPTDIPGEYQFNNAANARQYCDYIINNTTNISTDIHWLLSRISPTDY